MQPEKKDWTGHRGIRVISVIQVLGWMNFVTEFEEAFIWVFWSWKLVGCVYMCTY